MTSEEQRVSDGSAWHDFCAALDRAGDAVLREGTPPDPFQRAEGLRYLTRLLRAGLESHVESSDPCPLPLRVRLPERDEAALLCGTLQMRVHDPLFDRVLAAGARMV